MLTILLKFIKRPLVYCILFFLEDKQFLATRILVLATKNENLEASWPQDFFLKSSPELSQLRHTNTELDNTIGTSEFF